MTAFIIVNTQVFKINETPLKIGRSLENHLVLQEPAVSRYHAEIVQEGDNFYLVDLESTAGAFVNGSRVSRIKLTSGDSIILADVPLVFVNNAPQLNDKAKKPTGPLRSIAPDTKPTVVTIKPNWQPKENQEE